MPLSGKLLDQSSGSPRLHTENNIKATVSAWREGGGRV
ncbi:rCG31153 [Rattus norvegicus]|uniref:RCG31153 n=1 Tax=Rattus norvegicus TaxID=10116 RepID=A6IS65_RAT|nr:rCG31153 [Rattus norvegicus]